MSSALESSSGEWLIPPFRLRTKSIALGTPAAARIAGVVAGARRSSGAPGAAARSASSGAPLIATGSTRRVGSKPTAAISASSSAEVAGAHVDRGDGPRRDDVGDARARPRAGPRSPPCRAERPSGLGARTPTQPRARRRARPSASCRHGRRAPRRPPRPWAWPKIAETIPSGSLGTGEHRALLDVQLEVGLRQPPGLDAGLAPGAAALLVAEGDDRERARRSARPPRPRRPLRARRRTGPRSGRCRDASPSRPPPRPGGRRCSRPRRPRPRAPPRRATRRAAGAPRPPRASRRSGSRRSRRAPRGVGGRGSSAHSCALSPADAAKQTPAGERKERADREARPPRGAADEARRTRSGRATPRSQAPVCCIPSAVPLRACPAVSATAANESPFQLIVTQPIRTSAGTSSASGAASNTVQQTTSTAEPTAIRRSGRIRLCMRSDQRPAPIRVAIPKMFSTASTAPAAGGRHRPLGVQEDDEEPDEADLRLEQERASGRDEPDAAVAKRLGPAGGGSLRGAKPGRSRRTTRPVTAPARITAASVEERRARCRRPSEIAGSDERDPGARDRNCGLAKAEREAAIAGVEPVHHRAAARRVHARSEAAREEEQRDERRERRDEGARGNAERRRTEADREHRALAEPIGGAAPRVERPDRAERRAPRA